MANEKILNTRIRLKYDAYSTWYEKNFSSLSVPISSLIAPKTLN